MWLEIFERAVSLVSLVYKQPLCGQGESKVLAGGQQGSVLEGLGKMGLGDSSWVILLPDHGFRPQQVPSCLCTHLGDSQWPVLDGSRQHPQGGAAGYPTAEGRGESCMQANWHSHLASSDVSAPLSAPSFHKSPFPATTLAGSLGAACTYGGELDASPHRWESGVLGWSKIQAGCWGHQGRDLGSYWVDWVTKDRS